MPRPSVRLRVGDTSRNVGPGGIVGRLPGAELRLVDPRVSEALPSVRNE